MDKDRVKGTIDDTVGRAQRQAGEWTDNPDAQAEGTVRQAKGKAEKVWGNVKDAATREPTPIASASALWKTNPLKTK